LKNSQPQGQGIKPLGQFVMKRASASPANAHKLQVNTKYSHDETSYALLTGSHSSNGREVEEGDHYLGVRQRSQGILTKKPINYISIICTSGFEY